MKSPFSACHLSNCVLCIKLFVKKKERIYIIYIYIIHTAFVYHLVPCQKKITATLA